MLLGVVILIFANILCNVGGLTERKWLVRACPMGGVNDENSCSQKWGYGFRCSVVNI